VSHFDQCSFVSPPLTLTDINHSTQRDRREIYAKSQGRTTRHWGSEQMSNGSGPTWTP
jgi:hypothetical protein